MIEISGQSFGNGLKKKNLQIIGWKINVENQNTNKRTHIHSQQMSYCLQRIVNRLSNVPISIFDEINHINQREPP